MRQVFSSPRLENVDRVEAMMHEAGIDTYTGVAEIAWLQQILAFGWRCRPLGLPQLVDGRMLGALAIAITPKTPALLAANGILRPTELAPVRACEPA